MKSVIINADDFGLSPGVNRGILSGFREGVLTSTSLLANLPAFDDAVALARANSDLPIGVHLSLLWGRPVTEPSRVPTLVDRRGDFLSSAGALAARSVTGRLSREEIETEFRGQIRRVLDAGVRPTHLDTHKHIHCLPLVRQALLSVAGAFGIERVRLPLERCPGLRGGPRGSRSWRSRAKQVVVSRLCRGARKELGAAGLRTTDHFVGIAHSARLDAETLLFILQHLEEGVTEVMCHPGHLDESMPRIVAAPARREIELEALRDEGVRRYIESSAIRLVNFGDL